MSKLKRFGIGLGIAIAVPGVLTPIWYHNHYTLPVIEENRSKVVSPNGYDTLQEALKLTVMEQGNASIRPKRLSNSSTKYRTNTLAERQALVQANTASIARTRAALAEEYLATPHTTVVKQGSQLRDQARLLIYAGDTYAEVGNLLEATRCYLDAIELGVAFPHGDSVIPLLVGHTCESMGRRALELKLSTLDAKTARAAADRLAKIEMERTPLREVLYTELHSQHHELEKLFTSSPRTAWNNFYKTYYGSLDEYYERNEDEAPSLKMRVERVKRLATITYQGPGPTLWELHRWVGRVAEQVERPWGPQRPPLPEPGNTYLVQTIGPMFPQTEFRDRKAHADLALLETKLRLRATYLETGRYPATMENLPTDPFSPTTSPLKYRSDGKTFTLWSVGPDAKDDNGTPPSNLEGDKTRKPKFFEDTLGDILA